MKTDEATAAVWKALRAALEAKAAKAAAWAAAELAALDVAL